MDLKLELNSKLWSNVYYNIRDEFYRLYPEGPHCRDHIRKFVHEQGIKINIDPHCGIWENVEIDLDDEEVTLFLLRWECS